MATIRIENETLFIDLPAHEKFFAFHGSFAIPLSSVMRASTEAPPAMFDSLRLLGTGAPGLMMAGTFLFHGELVFADVQNAGTVLVIDITGSRYKHLFIEVADAEADARRISDAISSGSIAKV